MITDLIIQLITYAFYAVIRLAPAALYIFVHFILPVILFIIYRIFAAKKLHEVAKMRGHRGAASFVLPLLLGIPGFIYVATLPDVKTKELQRAAQMALILEKESYDVDTNKS